MGLIVETARGGKINPADKMGHPDAGFRAHISMQSQCELAASLCALPTPPADMQGKTGGYKRSIPPREKYPPEEQTFAKSRSRDVPSTPLANMFTGRSGRPDSVWGKEDPYGMGAEEVEGAEPWETCSGSKDSAEDIEVEDTDKAEQDIPEVSGGKEAPGPGTVDLDRILNSITSIASSVALLQVQVDKE